MSQSKKDQQETSVSLPPMGFEIIRREFVRDKVALVSFFLFVGILLFVFIAPFFMDLEAATKVSLTSRYAMPGTKGFILGADEGGRDILVQLILGARNSLTIGIAVTIITNGIGIILGLISGYYGGKIDNVMMRVTDFIMILPRLVLIIAIVTIVRSVNVWTLIFVLSFISWTYTTRLFRTRVLSEASKDYIAASKTMGTPDWKIMLFELLPNLSSLLITVLTLDMAGNIGIETGLSYLGFGLPLGTPSLGTLIGSAKTADIIENKPWVWLPAVIFVLILMLAINYMGQALQRAADSKQRLG